MERVTCSLPIKAAWTSFMNVCNQSPLRLPKIRGWKLFTLRWLSFQGWGKERNSIVFDYNRSQYVLKRQWRTYVIMMRLADGYLYVTSNITPKNLNRRLEPMGLAKPRNSCGLTGPGLDLAHQEAAGRCFGRVWNRADLFLLSELGLLAAYPDLLLTLPTTYRITGSKFALSSHPRTIQCSLDWHVQAQVESLSLVVCSQTRYTVCGWVAIQIHWHIERSMKIQTEYIRVKNSLNISNNYNNQMHQ